MSAPAPGAGTDPAVLMHSILKRIATGPELSKDLSQEEACAGMRCVLEGRVDPVQAGVFLIALRMKRESDEENAGVLQAILDSMHSVIADVDEVLDIADPYDGFTRCLAISPFLPAVFAACGLPAVRRVCACGARRSNEHRGAAASRSDPATRARSAARSAPARSTRQRTA